MAVQPTFEGWAKNSQPWLLDEPTDEPDKRAKSAAREAWLEASARMRERCAMVCRKAAKAYEARGRHSGPGWQLSIYLEREIRSLATADEQDGRADSDASMGMSVVVAEEWEQVRTLLTEVRDALNCFMADGPFPAGTQAPLLHPTSSATATSPRIRDDSRFLAFWVLAWTPLVCILFLLASMHIRRLSEIGIIGVYFVFVYAIFAPALYRLFIQGPSKRGEGG